MDFQELDFKIMVEESIKIEKLEKIAKEIRLLTFKAITNAGGGHYGGSLSVIEILTVLYFYAMNVNPQIKEDLNRDRFILSKGHAGPALYTTLALRGYYAIENLKDLDKPLSNFPKHVDRLKLNGIDVSTGALGQGLSIACGMAIALKYDKRSNYIYIIMGDGEINSGQVWEAAMTASKYSLNNIIGFIDRNHLQIDGTTEEVMPLEPLSNKWQSFGWNVLHANGHNIKSLIEAINLAKQNKEKPNVIIAETIKGCGVSIMEGKWKWHSGKITEEEYKTGIYELSK